MEIPLFPLHTVLFPGVALPLHIFEERYRLMVARCLETETPFGVVLIRDGREVGGGELSIAGVGTFAAIREAERLPDGRYELLAVGIGRFAVREVDTDREPYLIGTVDPLPDRIEDPAEARRLVRRTTRRFVDYLHLMQPRDGEAGDELEVRVEIEVGDEDDPAPDAASAETDAMEGLTLEAEDASESPSDDDPELERGVVRRIRVPEDPGTLAHLLSGIVQIDLLQKQALLEAESVEERLAGLEAVLDQELLLLGRRLRRYDADATQLAERLN
jgi:Lon protease-like protein